MVWTVVRQSQNMSPLSPWEGCAAFSGRHILFTADSLHSYAWYGCWCPDSVHIFCMWRLCGGAPAGQREAQPEGVCQKNSLPGQPAAQLAGELEPLCRRSLVSWHPDLSQGQSYVFFCKTVKLNTSTNFYQRENKILTNACSCTRVNSGLKITLWWWCSNANDLQTGYTSF